MRIGSGVVRYGLLAVVMAIGTLAGSMSFLRPGTADLETVAAKQIVNTGPGRVAIKGYDPVAYFTEGRAVKGRPEFEHPWNEAKWRFASAANRDAFAADPDRYAPQYGGYCSGGVKVSKAWDADPEAWAIVDGKLYFAYDKETIEEFRKNSVAEIQQADQVWRSKILSN
jgi:hypothetical protein